MKTSHQAQRQIPDHNGIVGRRMYCRSHREWVRVIGTTDVGGDYMVKPRTGSPFITSSLSRAMCALMLFVTLATAQPTLPAPSAFTAKVTTNITPRLTSPLTNRVTEINGKFYTNAVGSPVVKKAHAGVTKQWDAVGPWPQFISYEVEVYDQIGKPPAIVTTTNCFYSVEASKDDPQRFIGRVRARDVALPNPSEWR